MLHQAAHDIYQAAAEATGVEPAKTKATIKRLLISALNQAGYFGEWEKEAHFDIWLKAVEDLTRISRAERGVPQ